MRRWWEMTSVDSVRGSLTRALSQTERGRRKRSGLASLDYVLILGVVLPMVAFIMWAGPRVMGLAYEMVCLLVSWPFM